MHNELRRAIKAEFPDLKFKVRTVDFTDLARDKAVFVESNEWGMGIGNQETFQRVKQIAAQYGAIASW